MYTSPALVCILANLINDIVAPLLRRHSPWPYLGKRRYSDFYFTTYVIIIFCARNYKFTYSWRCLWQTIFKNLFTNIKYIVKRNYLNKLWKINRKHCVGGRANEYCLRTVCAHTSVSLSFSRTFSHDTSRPSLGVTCTCHGVAVRSWNNLGKWLEDCTHWLPSDPELSLPLSLFSTP